MQNVEQLLINDNVMVKLIELIINWWQFGL